LDIHLEENDDSNAKQALQWTPQVHRNIEGDQRTRGKKIYRERKWTQQVSGAAGGRWRQQHKTELDGDK